MDISKYKEETLHELNKIKQEQLEIEKTCLKLSELKDNVIIIFCIYITYIYFCLTNIPKIIINSNSMNLQYATKVKSQPFKLHYVIL